MSIKRRTFIKGSFATGALAMAASAGLLKPTQVLAAWPENAFSAKNLDDAIKALLGSNELTESDINIKAPEIAENGAVVPISISSNLTDVESINIFVSKNPQPLVCSFELKGNVDTFVSTRIKMGETSDIVAIIRSQDKLFSAKKTVKVTIGGCGG